MIRVCCVCRKTEEKGTWRAGSADVLHDVTHVYCPDCYEVLMDELDRWTARRWSESVGTLVRAGQLQGI